MVTVIDYGVGNLTSIKNMLKKIGYHQVVISADKEEIESSERLILPGVGHFDYGMRKLKASGLVEVINEEVLEKKKPILGICLGAQLLTRGSDEGVEKGLGWIAADTVKFDSSKLGGDLKVPHMGWSEVKTEKNSLLFQDIMKPPRFYFVHTYHIVCDDPNDVLVTADYGYRFTAGVEKDNILGMQFHPEKSHKYGMQILRNFINHY